MKKAVRSIIAVLIALTMMLAFAACNKANDAAKTETTKATKATESEEFQTATDNDDMEFISSDGWRVVYNAKDIESMEVDSMSVSPPARTWSRSATSKTSSPKKSSMT